MTKFESRLTAVTPAAVSVFRIVLGLLFTIRGTQKLFDWPIAAPVDIAFGSFPLWWAGVIELLAGVLILIGFVTRFAAFIASGQMAFAYFMTHQPKGLWPVENGGELPIVLCFGFLLLVFTGGGAYALDAMRAQPTRKRGRARTSVR